MKNRRKKLAAMLLAFAMTGMVGAGVFHTPGILTVMASGTEEQTETESEMDTSESETAETVETGEEPQVAITISVPENWQKEKAVVKITAEDTKQTGNFALAKLEAKLSEDGNWTDITSSQSMEVSKNSSIYVKVTDQNGTVYTENRYIDSFDTTKPTLSAAAKDGVLIIRGEDEGSGVAAIYVNGNEFTELTDNTLKVRLQQADTTYEYFTMQVRDKAGNMSENYKVANPYYENPDSKKAETSSTTETTGSTDTSTNTLPSDATASKPTSATGTVTEHTQSTQTDTTSSSADSTQTAGNASSSTNKKGKEFYTITTKGEKVFYLIVDKDKTSDNVYLLTEVGENDLLNFTDSNMVTLPQNSAVIESALQEDDTVLETEETKTEDKQEKEEAKEPEKSSNAGTYVLIVLVLLGVGGAYYYLKFIRGGKDSFEEDYEDEEEDEYETEMVDLDDTEESEEYEPDEEESEDQEAVEDEEAAYEKTESSEAEESYSDEEDYF
ncbi:MAG: DUF4366 domain-containing protein [Hespellia sp.]|nr:DUF4366 domain-containing protein [Hespellia sp.]